MTMLYIKIIKNLQKLLKLIITRTNITRYKINIQNSFSM